jgi:hypothetical protein
MRRGLAAGLVRLTTDRLAHFWSEESVFKVFIVLVDSWCKNVKMF